MSTNTYQSEFLTVTHREVGTDRLVSRVTRGPGGVLDSDGDQPAVLKVEDIGGRTKEIQHWYRMGKWHRERGPATVVTDLASSVVTQEVFAVDELIHQPDANKPALIHRDPFSGHPRKMEYYYKGRLHRENGPAVMNFDPRTGQLRSSEFWREGVRYEPGTSTSPEGPV